MDQVEAQFGTLISMNHSLLKAAGMSCLELDRVAYLSEKHGFTAKLTGAGGGGCALTFVPATAPNESLEELIHDLEKKGMNCFQARLGVKGIRINPSSDISISQFRSCSFEELERFFELFS